MIRSLFAPSQQRHLAGGSQVDVGLDVPGDSPSVGNRRRVALLVRVDVGVVVRGKTPDQRRMVGQEHGGRVAQVGNSLLRVVVLGIPHEVVSHHHVGRHSVEPWFEFFY